MHHIAVDISEPEITTPEAIGQLLVINTQQVQNCSVEVMNVYWVLDGVVAQFVGTAMGNTALDPTTGRPNGKPTDVVIAASLRRIFFATLGHGSSAELSPPDDQCIFKHTALLQVHYQGG